MPLQTNKFRGRVGYAIYNILSMPPTHRFETARWQILNANPSETFLLKQKIKVGMNIENLFKAENVHIVW